MKKNFLLGLLAAALFSATLTSCGPSVKEGDDDVATQELPPLPPAPDSSKNATPNDAYKELNSVNATADIKKMQPQM